MKSKTKLNKKCVVYPTFLRLTNFKGHLSYQRHK